MLYPYNHDDRMYTYRYIVRTFSDQQWPIACSPGLSSSLQRLGTSHMSPKKVQVATCSDFCIKIRVYTATAW